MLKIKENWPKDRRSPLRASGEEEWEGDARRDQHPLGTRKACESTPPTYPPFNSSVIRRALPVTILFPSHYEELTAHLRPYCGDTVEEVGSRYLEDVGTTPKLRSVLPPQAACRFDVSTAPASDKSSFSSSAFTASVDRERQN